MRMMRKNVLVDLGKTVNVLGGELIETPDFYKRINSMGRIVSVGPKCLRLGSEDEGKECVIGIMRHMENRIAPRMAKLLGLKEHWYFIVHENMVQMILC